MIKRIRFRTWYWGKWVVEGYNEWTLALEGFEEYKEEIHGWHLSEEARNEE